MARFLPPSFPEQDLRFGEQSVWKELDRQLPGEAVVFYSLRLPAAHGEAEIDFLVAWPGVGLAAIEVKGGRLERRDDGTWRSVRGDQAYTLKRSPIEQAREARYALGETLRRRAAQADRARIAYLAVFPHQDLDGYDAPDFRREQYVDEPDLDGLALRIRAAIEAGDGHAPLERDTLEELIGVLQPAMLGHPDAGPAEIEEHADALAQDLADRVSEWRHFPRLVVRGGAGSGKTWLAMAQAQRLAKAGQRVALVCYSRGLAAFLTRQAAQWKNPPAYVGLFHDMARTWGAPAPEAADSDYYEVELPRALRELARAAPEAQRFDAIVVDEGQDFGANWWPALSACLREADRGLYVFLDDDQRVFPREGEVPIDDPPIVLGRNLRNTKQIAKCFSGLVTEPTSPRGLKGAPVRYVASSTEDALARADDAVEGLLEEWDPGQVALLTTQHRHPVHREVIEDEGWDAYWAEYFAGESVLYGTVGGFKGLERSCVVLAVNGFSEQAKAKEMLYVGLSRARAQLVVVGDLDLIAGAGGEGVRKKLQGALAWQP